MSQIEKINKGELAIIEAQSTIPSQIAPNSLGRRIADIRSDKGPLARPITGQTGADNVLITGVLLSEKRHYDKYRSTIRAHAKHLEWYAAANSHVATLECPFFARQ